MKINKNLQSPLPRTLPEALLEIDRLRQALLDANERWAYNYIQRAIDEVELRVLRGVAQEASLWYSTPGRIEFSQALEDYRTFRGL